MSGTNWAAIVIFLHLLAATWTSVSAPPPPNGGARPGEPSDLIQKVTELRDSGRSAEALPWAERLLKTTVGERGAHTAEHADVLRIVGLVYFDLDQYGKAEPLLVRASEVYREAVGDKDSRYAKSLYDTARLYRALGAYDKSERGYLQALESTAEAVGPDHPDYAVALDGLASLYHAEGLYQKAEPLFVRSLEILRKVLGERDPQCATGLNDLGLLYQDMGLYGKAESAYQQALGIYDANHLETSAGYATTLSNLGLLRAALGQYTKAEPLYLQAIEIATRSPGGIPSLRATILNNLSELYRQMAQYGKAESLRTEEMGITKSLVGANHPDYATSLNNLALLYQEMGRYKEAEPLCLQAMEITKNALGENHPEYALSVANLAGLYEDMGLYSKAEPLYERALEAKRRALGEQHVGYAQGLNNLAGLYSEMGQYQKAESLYHQAQDIVRAALGERNPMFATALSNLGGVEKDLGRYAEAESLYLRALAIIGETLGETHPNYSVCLAGLASVFSDTARYSKAEELYQRQIALLEKSLGTDHPWYARSLGNMALLCARAGRYEQAEELYLRALHLTEKAVGKSHPAYANQLRNLGVLYKEWGQPQRAVPLFLQALAISRALGESGMRLAPSLDDAAGLYMWIGQYQNAEALYLQALEIRRSAVGEGHLDYAVNLSNLATLYAETGEYAKAEALYLKARDITGKTLGEYHPEYADRLRNLGALYVTAGGYAKAETLLLQALDIDERSLGSTNPDVTSDLLFLAAARYATGRWAEGMATQIRALTAGHRALDQVFQVSSEAAMLECLGIVGGGLDGLVSMAADAQSMHAEAAGTALTWVLRQKGIVLGAMCRLRDAESRMDSDPGVGQRVVRLRGLRQRLDNLARGLPPDVDVAAGKAQMAALRQECDQLEAELNRSLAEMHGAVLLNSVDVNSVCGRLPRDSALVEFVKADVRDFGARHGAPQWKPAHYFAFILLAGEADAPRLIDLGAAAEIDETIGELRESMNRAGRAFARAGAEGQAAIEKSREGEFRAKSRELYSRIFAPLRSPLGRASTVYVAPDGELHRVPLEALVGEQGEYLVERYRFVYLSSGRDLLRPARVGGRGTIVFAGPDYNLTEAARRGEATRLLASLPPRPNAWARGTLSRDARGIRWDLLPGATAEANDIAQVLAGTAYGPVTCYTGPDALEEVFKAVPAPRVLHVATHGFLLPDRAASGEDRPAPLTGGSGFEVARGLARLREAEDPLLRSGIVLAGANALGSDATPTPGAEDGWVTAEEIAMMDLQGTELVVLSACESGLGDVKRSEGVYGLRRAFQYAGAGSLLTSLFKVPDAETQQMMRRFYAGLGAGKGKLASLRDAQLETIHERRAEHGAAHPFFWASFVLLGDPN